MLILNFTDRARRYVEQSPQTKKLSSFSKERLIKGMARLMTWAYKEGFEAGTHNLAIEGTENTEDAEK